MTAAQVRDVVTRLIEVGHWRQGDPAILVVFDAGYDVTRLAWLLADLPAELLGRLRRVLEPPHAQNRSGLLAADWYGQLVADLADFRQIGTHRADAHAAAWQAAGLASEAMMQLPAGPVRAAIEAETNRRAGVPYATLSVDERVVLLAGLAALPG